MARENAGTALQWPDWLATLRCPELDIHVCILTGQEGMKSADQVDVVVARVSAHESRRTLREMARVDQVHVRNETDGAKRMINAKFVSGAGGGALPLLQKSGIPEAKGFGGFPVSGQWLRCDKAELVDRHNAKVYGKAAVGSPPMSVPHLDTRVIDGKRSLLFGPYVGFSTKFLKHGSPLDLAESVKR